MSATGATDETAGETSTSGNPPIGPFCGTCPEGQYCHWQPDSDPNCGSTSCTDIPSSCARCFVTPADCQPDEWCTFELCYESFLFNSIEMTENGMIVVHCSAYGDTDCTL